MTIAFETRVFEKLDKLVESQNDLKVALAKVEASTVASSKLAEASNKVAEQAVTQTAEVAKDAKAQIKEIHDLM
ncbi:MAG: hypothetical protein IMZ50_13475, partial [Candidatus Atribacteria bacterium]|nr:hypothetical protein [Candidatus Atribacteria bacterium]